MNQLKPRVRVEWRRETILCQQGALSIMVGRKRKRNCYRERNGQPQRVPRLSQVDIARQMPHRSGLSDKDVIDQKAESQFGRFALHKLITQEQFDAGISFRDTVARYRAVINAPSHSPRSIAGAVTGGGGGHGVEMQDEEAIRRKSAYDEMHDSVMEYSGMAGLRVLTDATVHERHIEPWRLVKLREALAVLVGIAYRGKRKVLPLTNQRQACD